MVDSKCSVCKGTGRVLENAQPGYKYNAGMGTAMCRNCGGSGLVRGAVGATGGGASFGKIHPVAWVFAIIGGILGAALEAVGVNSLLGAIIGFMAGGASANFLVHFRIGRRILISVVVLFLAILALGAFLSK
ncbi:MAG TPA: hypothetical protein P5072_15760 [Parvularculaceae bacterium]|nr:hypothetical protein [Parvularculaceae bacterium]